MAKKYNHIHKLQLHKYKNGTSTYFCVLNCSFKIDPALTLGKEVICHKCGNIFEMNAYSMKLKYPHCDKCHTKRNKESKIVVGGTHDKSEPLTAKIEQISSANDNPVQSLISRMRQKVVFETIKEEDLL